MYKYFKFSSTIYYFLISFIIYLIYLFLYRLPLHFHSKEILIILSRFGLIDINVSSISFILLFFSFILLIIFYFILLHLHKIFRFYLVFLISFYIFFDFLNTPSSLIGFLCYFFIQFLFICLLWEKVYFIKILKFLKIIDLLLYIIMLYKKFFKK